MFFAANSTIWPMRVVVDAVDDRDDQRDLDSDLREVLDRAHLHVEQIADAAMLVLLFADAVELQINAVLARGLRGFAKLNVFGETNSQIGNFTRFFFFFFFFKKNILSG